MKFQLLLELTNASYYSDGDDKPNNDGRQESDQKDHQGPKPCNTQAKNEIWGAVNHIHKIYKVAVHYQIVTGS